MNITTSLIDKLIRLRDGECLAISGINKQLLELLLSDGALISRSHGSRTTVSAVDKESLVQSLSRIDERLSDLEGLRALMTSDQSTSGPLRAQQAAKSGNSKMSVTRTFTGFLVNTLEAVECTLGDKPYIIDPPMGAACFIFDWQSFSIPSDAIVVGVENPENFRFVRLQESLFRQAFVEGTLIFVSRYPLNQSHDLRAWLLSIPNQYVHFGDMDLAGINIYQTEYYRYLGERASLLMPTDYAARIANGSAKRYNEQLRKFATMKVMDPRVEPLLSCIHQHHRCYDQEGWIETTSVNAL